MFWGEILMGTEAENQEQPWKEKRRRQNLKLSLKVGWE
jgi:hypothetical protein